MDKINNSTPIKAYKGFNPDFTCRGMQYEVGKEYEMPEEGISVCNKGFHACESPLEVLGHYFLTDKGEMCRFAEVEQSGKIDREEGGTKVCSSRIKLTAELKFGDIVKAGAEWLKEVTRPWGNGKTDLSDNGGNSAKIGSIGDHSQIGSSSDNAKIGSSGYNAKIGSSGYNAKISSSGDYAQIGSSGDCAQIGSSGDNAKIDSTGEDSVICCAGHGSRVRAKLGSWVTLSEWKKDEKKYRYVPLKVVSFQIDGETYKPDTWYMMENGEIIEAD